MPHRERGLVSVLNREPMWLKFRKPVPHRERGLVSVLNREPMWLKCARADADAGSDAVSVLNREPMWLKFLTGALPRRLTSQFQCSTVSRCG